MGEQIFHVSISSVVRSAKLSPNFAPMPSGISLHFPVLLADLQLCNYEIFSTKSISSNSVWKTTINNHLSRLNKLNKLLLLPEQKWNTKFLPVHNTVRSLLSFSNDFRSDDRRQARAQILLAKSSFLKLISDRVSSRDH